MGIIIIISTIGSVIAIVASIWLHRKTKRLNALIEQNRDAARDAASRHDDLWKEFLGWVESKNFPIGSANRKAYYDHSTCIGIKDLKTKIKELSGMVSTSDVNQMGEIYKELDEDGKV